MARENPLQVEILAIRPDVDDDYLEGSACTLRLDVHLASDVSPVGQSQSLPWDTRSQAAPDMRFLTLVRAIFANLVASESSFCSTRWIRGRAVAPSNLVQECGGDRARAASLDVGGGVCVGPRRHRGTRTCLGDPSFSRVTSSRRASRISPCDRRSVAVAKGHSKQGYSTHRVRRHVYAVDCDLAEVLTQLLESALTDVGKHIAVTWLS